MTAAQDADDERAADARKRRGALRGHPDVGALAGIETLAAQAAARSGSEDVAASPSRFGVE